MRHDPASGAVIIMLRSLKMFHAKGVLAARRMAQAVTDLMEQGAPAFDAAVPIVSQLLKAELAEREVRSIAYHMKAARFPAYKDLSGFDFAASEINEATMRQLHKCEFMDAAPSIVLIHCPPLGIIPWMTLPGNGTGYCEAMSQEGAVLAQAKRMPPQPSGFRL